MGSLQDAVIIGAGPAGSAAAIELARAGLEVTLVEAAEFPRHRPGESLHPGVEPIFEKLGVAEKINAAGFIRHAGHHIDWQRGEPERFDAFGEDERGQWLGYQAWRPDLDQVLLDAAVESGARLLQPSRAQNVRVSGGSPAILETSEGAIEAKFVLDASGRNQWLSRKLEVPWDTRSAKLTARYSYVEGLEEIAPRENPRMCRDDDGWTWVAPVGTDRIAWVRMRFDGVDPGPDWLPSELADAAKREASRGADVTWRIAEQVAGDGWILIGDAAAVLDPAASHGVLRSLMSGMKAASLIVASAAGKITQEQSTEHYSQWLRQWFDSDVDRLRDLYEPSTG